MGVADDERDAGERGQLFGSALGVTAGDDEARGGIAGMDFADGVAGLGVGGGGDGAGVEDDEVGVVGRGGGVAATGEELAFDGGAVRLRGAAAELLNEEGSHGVFSAKNEFTTERAEAPEGARERSCLIRFGEPPGTLRGMLYRPRPGPIQSQRGNK